MKAEGRGEIAVNGDSGEIALVQGRFFGGEIFDPADADAYLDGFAIRAADF